MYIFTRYVVAEILKIFLLTLAAITLLVTIAMGVKEGAARGCPPSVVLHLMPYMLPEMLVITIPVSLLLASSIVYGRMTGSNEIIALKSLGISPMDVIWPTIVLALLFSLATLYLQEVAATKGRPNVARVFAESIEEIAYGMLQKEGSCKVPQQFEITVVTVQREDKMLISPTITIYGKEPNQDVVIRASKAKLETNRETNALTIQCWDAIIEQQGFTGKIPGLTEQAVTDFNLSLDDFRFHRDWVAMHDIPEKIAGLQKLVDESKQERAALLAQTPSTPEAEATRQVMLGNNTKTLTDRWRLIHRLRTEPFRRLSNGFTCLCFVLIGAPVAMLWRHTDVLTNFFVCFLPILAIYYPLLMIGEDLSTSGKLPPFSFWMGNVTLIVPGIFLLKYVVKH